MVALVAAAMAPLAASHGCRRRQSVVRASRGASGLSAQAVAGERIFQQRCVACHTVGQGRRLGPDLKDVHQRRDAAWLTRWMADPIGMGRTDPIGQRLVHENNNLPMPPPGLSAAEVEQVLTYVREQGPRAVAVAAAPLVPLNPQELERSRQVYFNRCAGCHGTMRAGATGPNIQETRSRELTTDGLVAILTNGTPRGMPAWGRAGIMTSDEIALMARYLQQPAPAAPRRPMEEIRASWQLRVPVAQRTAHAPTSRNWENYFGVVLRDAGKVAIIDGDTHQMVTVLDTGFAVHILRSSSTGRYFYAVGRDGRVTLIDLWGETPSIVATVQGCFDARSVEASKAHGFEDRYIIEGCYWPPQYVVYDGLTLEPQRLVPVNSNTFDTNEPLQEVRVASIVPSRFEPLWVITLKESGYVGLVDYSNDRFAMTSRIGVERFLHDGGWDHTGRYFMVAANMRNRMGIVDVQQHRLVTTFETGVKPHPGRGANWEDPQYGWVNATGHIGEGRFVVYGADPEAHPEHAWHIVRNIPLQSTGSLFVKTHPSSPWVWIDSPLSNDENATREVCVYSKQAGVIHRCWRVAEHGRGVHFEYNRQGTEVWVSLWDQQGEIIVYNDRTLEEVTRIRGDWLVTPTGKFNVYNTAHDVY